RDHGCRGPVAPVGGEAREHDGHDDGDDNDDDDQFENREAGAGRASREASHPRSGAESREPACGQYLVSSQLSPTPMSTTSGTDSWVACSISCFTRTVISSTSSGGASKTSSSCTCRIICVRAPAARNAWWIRIIAILIRSAAEPWMGEFVAVRSPNCRMLKFRSRNSGI